MSRVVDALLVLALHRFARPVSTTFAAAFSSALGGSEVSMMSMGAIAGIPEQFIVWLGSQ